jgi:hypothetical protein
MKALVGVAVGAIFVAIVAFATLTVSGAIRDSGRPHIELINSCRAEDNGGTLTLKSRGFTPARYYHTVVTLNGKYYFSSWGTADKDGQASSWHWPCDKHTKPGVYRVVVFDGDNLRPSNRATFTVSKPESAAPATDRGSAA